MRPRDTNYRWALELSPEWLREAIVEASHDAVLTHDVQGNLTTWNLTAERFFGYTPSETLGRSLVTLPKARARRRSCRGRNGGRG